MRETNKTFYIITINDTDNELKTRLKTAKWPLFSRTLFREQLKKNDGLLIYRAGNEGHKFLGTAIVGSISTEPDGGKTINLISIITWKNPVHIKKILEKISFIKNKEHYGAYLAGGVTKISEDDFKIITKYGEVRLDG